MAREVVIEVNGEEGRRYSVRCKWCRSTFVEEHEQAKVYRGTLIVGASHTCEKLGIRIEHFRGRWPEEMIRREAFRSRVVCWSPKPGGILTECNMKCQGAKGHDCDCKCKGQNHGRVKPVDIADLPTDALARFGRATR